MGWIGGQCQHRGVRAHSVVGRLQYRINDIVQWILIATNANCCSTCINVLTRQYPSKTSLHHTLNTSLCAPIAAHTQHATPLHTTLELLLIVVIVWSSMEGGARVLVRVWCRLRLTY